MKYLLLLLALYFFYKYFLRQPKPLKQPQEPDLYIDHEEVSRDHEKNK